jgi:transcriptional regulator with XRE-family HTH domain
MSINGRIKQVRLALKLTQSKMAERVAVSISYLSDMERGDTKVNDRVIRLVAMEFNVSEHWIRTGEGEMFSDDEAVAFAQAMSLFKLLTPKHRKCALAQLNALAELQSDKEDEA